MDTDKRMREFAEQVRARRRQLGLRQEELAELAGTSARFVVQLEAGKPSVRTDKVLDVLEALGLEVQLKIRGT